MKAHSQQNTTEPLTLVGLKGPDIQPLEGMDWGTQLTQTMFEGATWAFCSDGTFLFTPSPLARVRMDLYPILGKYSRTGNLITFQGEKESSDVRGASACLKGTICLSEKDILLEVVLVVTSSPQRKVAKVTQQLSQQPQKEPTVEIAGMRVPSIFKITLEGTLEKQPFGPLDGTLKILPRHQRDPNPFLVDLSTDVDRVNGGISWTSFVPTRSQESELCSKIQVEKGQIHLNVESGSHFRVGIMWFTSAERASPSKYRHLLAGILTGTTATSGKFTFSVQGDRISGNILAFGKTNMGGDPDKPEMGGDPSTYEARLLGQRVEL